MFCCLFNLRYIVSLPLCEMEDYEKRAFLHSLQTSLWKRAACRSAPIIFVVFCCLRLFLWHLMAFGLAALNGIEWQRTPKECLMTGALPFSDHRERLSFFVIQRVQRAIAILLRSMYSVPF